MGFMRDVCKALGLLEDRDERAPVRALRLEVEHLRAQVEAVARAGGVDLSRVPRPAATSEAVRALIRQGKDVAAIKQHREDTGLGLAEAKAEVDEARRTMN